MKLTLDRNFGMKHSLGKGILIVHESLHWLHADHAIVELLKVHFVLRSEAEIVLIVGVRIAVVVCSPSSVSRVVHVLGYLR
jgi:hypothetical protein